MSPEWFQLVLGPLGALVLATVGASLFARELRRRHEQQLQQLSAQLERSEKERAALQAELRTEHAARLDDARATTQTLLDLNDRIHRTLDGLEALTRASAGRMTQNPP